MHIQFIQDLAVIMLIAGFITILFHQFKQPVVLGYIIAGVIIGPHIPPFSFVYDERTIKIFAELGVVFLMFSLGLEFNIRKLKKVGLSALIASLIEIVAMIWMGYEIGIFFHWSSIDALFLGAMLAISSTTIIVKALNELKMQREDFAQLIFGILVVEDILAIAILALLSSIATTHSIHAMDILTTLGQLLLFLIVTFIMGILTIPRLLSYVAKFKSHEMLLVTVLGLCFGFCLLVIKLHYSIVLGAFIVGTIVAESNQLPIILRLIAPIRDMFSAVFFVAIGLMLNPSMILTYWLPIVIISIAVIVGKVLSCSLSTFMTGKDGRTALRVGMGLAQIGEFSFIIASLGISLKISGDFLYPIAVSVSAITAFSTPYLIKFADPLVIRISKMMPSRVVYIFSFYTKWLQNLQLQGARSELAIIIRGSLLHIFINLALVMAIFMLSSYFASYGSELMWHYKHDRLLKTLIWGSSLIVSLPFLISVYHKIKSVSILLAEYSVKANKMGRLGEHLQKIVSELIPIASMIGIFFFLCALSTSILPPSELLIAVLVFVAVLVAFLWRWFARLHARLHIQLLTSIDKSQDLKD